MTSLLFFVLAIAAMVAGWFLFESHVFWGLGSAGLGLALFFVGALINHEEHTSRK